MELCISSLHLSFLPTQAHPRDVPINQGTSQLSKKGPASAPCGGFLGGRPWLVVYFHDGEGHHGLVLLKVVMGLLCWTGTKDTGLELFILGAAQTWGERTDFALM